MTRQAYPGAPTAVISTLARDHFIDALTDSDMRLYIQQSHPKTLEVTKLAVELELFKAQINNGIVA